MRSGSRPARNIGTALKIKNGNDDIGIQEKKDGRRSNGWTKSAMKSMGRENEERL